MLTKKKRCKITSRIILGLFVCIFGRKDNINNGCHSILESRVHVIKYSTSKQYYFYNHQKLFFKENFKVYAIVLEKRGSRI